jgi:beta-N-acetylhexosaminidase
MGINVNCAPVLDLLHPGTHPVIGDRSFGGDPLQVAALGRAVIDGLAENGVTAVVKHMPGHGRARADSHKQLPLVSCGKEELEPDLAPFRALAGRARIAMTAHVLFEAWDAERPATVSPHVIGRVIRGRTGFDGLLISDDITMAALAGTCGERACAALEAGCDLVLHCSGILGESAALARDLPKIGPAAAERLARAVVPIDDRRGAFAALTGKRDALLTLAPCPGGEV